MIKLENLSKSFGNHLVIDNLNLEFKNQQFVCILSASGTGKTTLFRIIAGLDKQYTGKVSGVQNVSVTFQEDRLFPWLTAQQNIEIVSNSEIAKTLLEQMQLSQVANQYPNELSGGMCRRVSLARSLAYQSDVLILDEPLKGLDVELKERISSLILECTKSKIVIMTTHDMFDAAKIADRVLCFSSDGFKVEKDLLFDVQNNKRDEKTITNYIEKIKA